MMKTMLMLIIVAVVVTLFGCAVLEEKISELSGNGRTTGYPELSNTVKQGCLGGFAVGVLHSLVKQKLLEREKEFSLRKLLRDVTVGAGIGCTVAVGLDKRRENFASDADHFEAELVDARYQNDEMQKLIDHTRSLTTESRNTLRRLQANLADKKLEKNAVAEARSNAIADHKWAKKELAVAKSNINQRKAASGRMKEAGDTSRSGQMNDEIRELQNYVTALESEVASLVSINDAIGQLPV